jgi:hypothetical protein
MYAFFSHCSRFSVEVLHPNSDGVISWLRDAEDLRQMGPTIPRKIQSRQRIPCAAPAAVKDEMPLGDKLAEVLFHCVSARTSQPYDVADGYAPVFAGAFDDAQ